MRGNINKDIRDICQMFYDPRSCHFKWNKESS